MIRHSAAVAAALALTISGAALSGAFGASNTTSPALTAALEDAGRDPAQMLADTNMKPAEVLTFAGIKPGMMVDHLVPGDGYYTRILAKLVGPKGHLYATVPFAGAINAETLRRERNNAHEPIDDVMALQNMIHYQNTLTVIWQFIGLDGGAFATPYQLDVAFTDNYHVLHVKKLTDTDEKDLPGFFGELFSSIKPGGSFVVSDAVAAKGAGFTQAESLGRVEPDAVKAELVKAGFTFDGQSDALANPYDDHSKAAASLDGKADKFLMRFKKPANAPADKRAWGQEQAKVLYGNTWISSLGKDQERRLFYHTDSTYEELGKVGSLLQEGYWFLDSKARVCILHQYPLVERGYIICSVKLPMKVGERKSIEGRRGPSILTITKGTVYMDHSVGFPGRNQDGE